MSTSRPYPEASSYMQLRHEAETRLEAGTAKAYSSWSLGVDALHLLHRLSSNPETAGDAIKLLHELQIHQVELDLQNEEMLANEQRLADELAHYKGLYEFAPVGYFLVDFQGGIIESNHAGADLLGASPGELAGRHLNHFLTAESRSVLLGLLERASQDDSTQAGEVYIEGAAGPSLPLRLMANPSPDKRYTLLACHEIS